MIREVATAHRSCVYQMPFLREENMLKTIARKIPQIDRLVQQRDELLERCGQLQAELDRYNDSKEFAVKAAWDWFQKSDLFDRFIKQMSETPSLRILELGSRRVPGRDSTTLRRLANPTSEYVGCDFQAGDDVDIVADAHTLSQMLPIDSFDMILTIATYEHLSRPWIATNQIAKVLKPGGRLYIRTHQTFPLHAHPHDYFRFSTEALSLLCQDAGLKVEQTAYEYPVSLVSFMDPKGSLAPSYIHVEALAVKPV
jgi:SAM-dependent methyltransferase